LDPAFWSFLELNRGLEELSLDQGFTNHAGIRFHDLFTRRWSSLKYLTLVLVDAHNGAAGGKSEAMAFWEFIRAHPHLKTVRIPNWPEDLKLQDAAHLVNLTTLCVHPALLTLLQPGDQVTTLIATHSHTMHDHDLITAAGRFKKMTSLEFCAVGLNSAWRTLDMDTHNRHYNALYERIENTFPKLEHLRIRYTPWPSKMMSLVC